MRYAIVSDIHANWQAWVAVRNDIRKRAVNTTVCLGDIVGYGPSPTRVVSDLRAHCDNFVLGNHDAAAAGKLDLSVFNENARRSAQWTAAQFDRATLKLLGEAPLVLEDEDIIFTHAETPAPDEFGYVETTEDARACFEATDKRFIFIGHTHRPTVFARDVDGAVTESAEKMTSAAEGVRYLVNVGSVGDPGDGSSEASYCIFDTKFQSIELRKVAFDVAAFSEELKKVPELSMPWFLERHEGEAVRPSYDQAVAVGKVAGTKIRVTTSKAKIRVKASALATQRGDSLRTAEEASSAAGKKSQKVDPGLITLVAIGLIAIGAMAGIYLHYRPAGPESTAATAVAKVVPAPVASAQPVALTFRLTASREERENGKTNSVDRAMDGDPNTRWCAGDGLLSHWVQIDLGVEQRLSGVQIMWEFADRSYGYKIEGSVDAKQWTQLAAGEGKSADDILFATTARYIRINVTKLPDQKWASIAEIKLFDGASQEIRPAKTVAPAPQVFVLRAADAKLNAKKLKWEKDESESGFLGYWVDAGDYPSWTFSPAIAGLYEAELTFSLPPDCDLSEIAIECGDAKLKLRLHATGSWTAYKTSRVGTLRLPAGPNTLAIRSVKKTGGAVMNVRTIALRRVGD